MSSIFISPANFAVPAPEVAHVGYVCDRCGVQPIRGIRWKCANCADYDLCSACEALDLHDQNHTFLKIRRPLPSVGPALCPLLPNTLKEIFTPTITPTPSQQDKQQPPVEGPWWEKPSLSVQPPPSHTLPPTHTLPNVQQPTEGKMVFR